jgi:uncharacterized repeat protein (TIGR03837 family)
MPQRLPDVPAPDEGDGLDRASLFTSVGGDGRFSPPGGTLWDIFCRVVDNYGDIGVCWRLAADLGARGQLVRLWVDDRAALAWMAPDGTPGVEVLDWTDELPPVAPGNVVVEAFACDPPPGFVAAMARCQPAPVWINLEYLSAEAWVERCHGLPSPQGSGPGRGLTKHFFHPGFTAATGGLLREPGLLQQRAAFDAAAWRLAHGLATAPGERLVTLFGYENASLQALPRALGTAPTLLALTPCPARAQLRALPGPLPSGLRTVDLPWLTQTQYDRLLWSADLNFVRGEDSLVRALWAGRPFVWQLYPQHDGAHGPKAAAFVARWREDSGRDTPLPDAVAALHKVWNDLDGDALPALRAALDTLAAPATADPHRPGPAARWPAAAEAFARCQARLEDLTTQLMRFAAQRATPHSTAANPGPAG